MSKPTIYVKANSKTELNRRLAMGADIFGTVYHCDGVDAKRLASMPHGSIVRVWRKSFGSTPHAHTYGLWNAAKMRVV